MLISLPHGVSLEADLEVPTGSQSTQENKLAILLHPWSWLGGRMNDPCVEAVSKLVLPLTLRLMINFPLRSTNGLD
jgi:alpha/beta superfamily hydrolase